MHPSSASRIHSFMHASFICIMHSFIHASFIYIIVGARNWLIESPASDTRPGRICLTPVRVIALVRFAWRASQSNLLIGKEEYVSDSEVAIGYISDLERAYQRIGRFAVIKKSAIRQPITVALWIENYRSNRHNARITTLGIDLIGNI